MALTANIGPGASFRGFSEGTNLRPKQDRSSIPQPRGAWRPKHDSTPSLPITADVDIFGDPQLVGDLTKIHPGFKDWMQRQQASQAEESQKAASSPFQSNRDIFSSDVVNQVAGERNIKAAEMRPANVTPGAKPIGKGGIIGDDDMNMDAAGSSLKGQGAGVTNNKVAGLAPFYRMRGVKFYGR